MASGSASAFTSGGKRQVAHVDGRAQLQFVDVDADRVRHVDGRALDFQGVQRLVEDAAAA